MLSGRWQGPLLSPDSHLGLGSQPGEVESKGEKCRVQSPCETWCVAGSDLPPVFHTAIPTSSWQLQVQVLSHWGILVCRVEGSSALADRWEGSDVLGEDAKGESFPTPGQASGFLGCFPRVSVRWSCWLAA